jgi:hypothetical protein
VSIDAGILLEHVQVIRSKIGPELIQKCRDVQNEPICANFWKKAKGIVLKPFFQTPLYLLDIFLILTLAFSRHIIKNLHLFD